MAKGNQHRPEARLRLCVRSFGKSGQLVGMAAAGFSRSAILSLELLA